MPCTRHAAPPPPCPWPSPVQVSEEEREAAEAQFKLVSEAHSVLSDPQQRRKYDAGWNLQVGGGVGWRAGWGWLARSAACR